jgi:predicted RecB family endonuclease
MQNNLVKPLFGKKKLEINVKESRDNLEEFMHVMAEGCDLTTFDILSITRADENKQYTQSLKHPRVSTQGIRVAYESAQIIPMPKSKRG